MITVGNGKYTYEQVENWEKLPEGWELGQTAIVTDSEDRVYLFNRSEHPLIVLDRNGNSYQNLYHQKRVIQKTAPAVGRSCFQHCC